MDVLNRVDRGTERTIMEGLQDVDEELADEIKKRMFVFEDLVTLDDRAVQLVLREVDNRELSLALKMASEEVCPENLSQYVQAWRHDPEGPWNI